MGVSAKELPDGTDDVGVGKHADLDRVEANIGDKRLDLGDDVNAVNGNGSSSAGGFGSQV